MNITKPILLLDERKCRANIRMMVEKAKINKLLLRPHFKTHQSKKVGEWFGEEGIEAITVSSLGMAEYFANAGWKEITVAFPVNLLQIDLINQLAGKIRLNLLTDTDEVLKPLEDQLEHDINIYIEIDSGAGRTGIPFNDHHRISTVVQAILTSNKLHLKGFYTHAGHSYQSRTKEEINNVFNHTVRAMKSVREWADSNELEVEYCMGDTPGCSIGHNFDGIDAISPGNFCFYDVMQTVIGSCNYSQIAVAMACPVVSKNSITREVCIYGGAVHFSKDSIEVNNQNIFGKIVRLESQGWGAPLSGCFVKSLSQEHGIIKLSEEEFERVQHGDVVGILPVHSCLTAEAMGYYLGFDQECIDHYAQKNRDQPG